MRIPAALAAVAAFSAAAIPAASADRIVLYENPQYRGRGITVTQQASDLGDMGLHGRAASMSVQGGLWEVCTQAHFRGRCRTYGPGEYPSLEGDEYRIASVRAVASASREAADDGGRRGSGEAEILLFDRRDFSGPLRTLTAATPNFERLGINDAAASIVVERGTWELCTDANYRGNCRTYGPGRYPSIPGGQDDAYSSARPVAGAAGSGRWEEANDAEVSLFDRRNFDGPLRTLRGEVPDFGPLGFNDAVASIIVQRGTWQFCTDAAFRGECRIYGPGRYPSLPAGQDDRYSSARPVDAGSMAQGRGRPSQGSPRIRLFEHGQFGGRSIWIGSSTPDLVRIGFNDRADSVIVESGTWILCSDANRGGACRSFGPGRYPELPRELRSRVSSAYPR